MLLYKALKKAYKDLDVTLNDDKSIVVQLENSKVVFEYVEDVNKNTDRSVLELADYLSDGMKYKYSEVKDTSSLEKIRQETVYRLDDTELLPIFDENNLYKIQIGFCTTKEVSTFYMSELFSDIFLTNVDKSLLDDLINDGNITYDFNKEERYLSKFKDEINANDVLIVEHLFHSYGAKLQNNFDTVSIYVLNDAKEKLGVDMINIYNSWFQITGTFTFFNILNKNDFKLKEIAIRQRWFRNWDVKNVGYFEQQRVCTVNPTAVFMEYSPFTFYNIDGINKFYSLSNDEKTNIKNKLTRDEDGRYLKKAYELLVNEGLSRDLIKSLLSLRTKNDSEISTAVYCSSLLTARNIGVKMANYRKSYIDNSKLYKKFITFYELCALGHFSDLLDVIDNELKLKDAKTLLTTPTVLSKIISSNISGEEITSKITLRRVKKINAIIQNKESIENIISTFISIANLVKKENLVNIWVNDKYLKSLESNLHNIIFEKDGKLEISNKFLKENKCSNEIYTNLLESELLDAKTVINYGEKSDDVKLIFNVLSLFDNLLFRYER